MKIERKTRIILIVIMIGVVASGVGFWIWKKKHPSIKVGQPQQTVEEILLERARQAKTKLDTPLGKSFVGKNWAEFDQLYQPQKNFHDLAEIIRAAYIGGQLKSFTPGDMDRVLGITLKTFDEMRPQDISLAGLLISQFKRLPSPPHDSENFETLESWFSSSKTLLIKKKFAILKLGVQDSAPDAKWVKVLADGIKGQSFGADKSEWVQMIGEMRNLEQRKKVLKVMLQEFSGIEHTAQPNALVLLSEEPELAPKQLDTIIMKFLQSANESEFEAALKCILPLAQAKFFSADDVAKIKEILTPVANGAPNANTQKNHIPYVVEKAKEILNGIH